MYLCAVIGAMLSLTVISAIRPSKCGRNEKWTTCTGCELKCGEDPNKPCTADCKPPSCFCSPPFRRSPDGQCVPERQCSKKPIQQCGPNEQWTECTGCEVKCEDDPNKPCTADCKPPSCFCGAPFRRSSDGSCVPESSCPAKPNERCDRNEQWTECTGCEIKCGENPNKPCTANCRPPSCFCALPFRRAPDGKCVRQSRCSLYGK